MQKLPNSKAATTRYGVIEPISSYECNRTMTLGREPRMRRHTLLVTRTGANEYRAYTVYDKRFYSDRFRNNFLHTQTMASAILSESRSTILATVQHNWEVHFVALY